MWIVAPDAPLVHEEFGTNHCYTWPLAVGDVVRLGLSHPCTVFDKWRVIPVVADDGENPEVVDMISTYF